jgi:hypothetical protein
MGKQLQGLPDKYIYQIYSQRLEGSLAAEAAIISRTTVTPLKHYSLDWQQGEKQGPVSIRSYCCHLALVQLLSTVACM